LIEQVCRLAGDRKLVSETRRRLAALGISDAIRHHETAALFDWLAEVVSFQGIADRVAHDYMQRHGAARWADIAAALAAGPSCPKLKSYWHFENCGYRKTASVCNEPLHFGCCPLPTLNLRNGRLNQTAYSLFLFLRDVAAGDYVAWLDARLDPVELPKRHRCTRRLREALLGPMGQIFGVSDKVVSMTLATLLLGAAPGRPTWIRAGAELIAIDRLVHNFFVRTGILQRLGEPHRYGPRCYERDGCADIIDQVADHIDARAFNARYPRRFPRFVQHAIWQFCAEEGLDECNGRQIDDRKRCDRKKCPLFRRCDRIALKRAQKPR
jgi:hypothetical protein